MCLRVKVRAATSASGSTTSVLVFGLDGMDEWACLQTCQLQDSYIPPPPCLETCQLHDSYMPPTPRQETCGFRVWGLGVRGQGLGFRVYG